MGRVLGNYVLGDVLGDGGMGRVFAAEHRFLGDPVAVKVLRPGLGEDPRAVERFLAEATRTRSITHPNVVRVLDFGRADDGTLYLVMERLKGEDLKSQLTRRGRLPETEVRRLGAAVADGMAAAHALGIVHRDLKPANLLITEDGDVKILDFGIARQWTGPDASTDSRAGTVEYMAPEQVTGGVLGPATDVFALGVVLFRLATGQLPWTGYQDGACPQLHLPPRQPRALAPLSPAFESLLLDCLRSSPAARPASMREVRERLLGVDGERHTAPVHEPAYAPTVARGDLPGAPQPAARPSRALPVAVVAILAAAAGLAAVELAHRGPARSAVAAPELPVAAAPTSADDEQAAAPEPTTTTTTDEPAPEPRVALAAPPTVIHPARAHAVAVLVRSRPVGAQVTVDGIARAVTPGRLSLKLPQEVVVSAPGYRPAHVVVGKPGTVDVRLEREPGRRSPVHGERLD